LACLWVFIEYLGDSKAAKMDDILKHLKLCKVEISEHYTNCPYYAGPVVFCVMNGVDLKSNKAALLLRQLRLWVSKQPSGRPHWNLAEDLQLAKLIDSKHDNDNWEAKSYF
jgi:hypothetical protein